MKSDRQFDYNRRLILLSVIQLSGGHCIYVNIVKSDVNVVGVSICVADIDVVVVKQRLLIIIKLSNCKRNLSIYFS